VTITAPPAGTNAYLKRVSPTMPTTPILNSLGRPNAAYVETSTAVEDWGRFQVTFGTTDVTFLRGIPCEVVSYSSSEPFGDELAVIKFPQISPFDTLGTGDLAPFADWANVTINRVYFDTGTNQEVVDSTWSWSGLWVSQDVERDEASAGTTFHCVGCLYEADFRVALPSLDPVSLSDIGTRIFERLSGQNFRFTAPVVPAGGLGVTSPDLGAYQPVLTGLIQDYLAVAYDSVSLKQWTVTNTGRACTIVLKDTTTTNWTMSAGVKGLTLRLSRDLTQMTTAIYGSGQSPADGCDWRNAFYPGLATGSLFGFLIRPLSVDTAVEPNLYNSTTGEVTGANGSFNSALVRVERYENFGRLDKATAAGSAGRERVRLGEGAGPSYTGTLTLRIDPQQGGRWVIRAGQNVLLTDVRGNNLLLHVSRMEASVGDGRVTLTVDTKARDLPTLGAAEQRRNDNTDLVRRKRPTRNQSRIVDDTKVPFDCESGAGVVPTTSLTSLTWKVIRIPMATRGSIVQIDLQASSAVELSAALFDRPILPTELASKGSPADLTYWDYANWNETSGLVQAWGAGDDLGGYGRYSANDILASGASPTLTGRLLNDNGAPYVSTQPPWLWLCMWATGSVTISGLVKPGPAGA